MQHRYVSVQEYLDMVHPQPGFVVIHKDKGAQAVGKIQMTANTRAQQVKWGGSGIIKKMSRLKCNEDYDNYLSGFYKEGDRVGFNATNPLDSPFPPYCSLKRDEFDDLSEAIAIIHIQDILCLIADTKEEQEVIQKRLEEYHG